MFTQMQIFEVEPGYSYVVERTQIIDGVYLEVLSNQDMKMMRFCTSVITRFYSSGMMRHAQSFPNWIPQNLSSY